MSRLSLLLFIAMTACSSSSSTDPPGQTGQGGPFALHVQVNAVDAKGAPNETFLFVAVRDADSHEVVAFFKEDEKVISTATIDRQALLQKGHRYEIGVKDTWYANCLDRSSNVWYRALPPVDADVSITWPVTADVDEDQRGCDVLHEPVALPAGKYATTTSFLGDAANRVELVVSDTGRIYGKTMRVYCSSTSSCLSTSVSIASCEEEEVVYPGEQTFSLGSEAASHTTVEGEATIDSAAGTIRYQGRVYTWVGSTTCCDENFDVTLKRVGSGDDCR